MTEENMNKVYWVIACGVILLAIGTYMITPSYNKVKAQESTINGITYTAPSGS